MRQLSVDVQDLQQGVQTLQARKAELTAENTAMLQHILVGEARRTLDNIVVDYVFGPYGSRGRPRARMSISHIHDMELLHEFNSRLSGSG